MIEDIKHWKGNSQFKRGYERAQLKKRYFTTEFYLDPHHYTSDFIAGFKRGQQRKQLQELVLGTTHE